MALFTNNPRRKATTFKVVLSPVFAVRQYFQILKPIIGFIAVFMMNVFVRFQRTPKMLGHYKTMLSNVTAFLGVRVFGFINHHVTVGGNNSPAFPHRGAIAESSEFRMTRQERNGETAKSSRRSPSVFRNFSFLSAPAFADSRRDFFGRRGVFSRRFAKFVQDAGGVSCQISGLVVFTSFAGIRNFVSAPAFTIFHKLIIAK